MPESPPGIQVHASARSFWMVACCFLLSGFAALLYETVWLRQFSIFFGTSDQSLAVVLGTYMGGLAIGSLIASRIAPTLRRPLLTYGILELGIGVSALMVPLMMSLVRKIQVMSFGGGTQPPAADELSQILFSLAGAFAATILPTTMMGATLPLLAKHVVSRNEHLGSRIGFLYTINTLGAVLGTLTAAFVCLPTLGLGRTIYTGVMVNILVFVLVWRLLGGSKESEPIDGHVSQRTPASLVDLRRQGSLANERSESNSQADDHAPRDWILWWIGFSGAVSFCYEILFTRMLGHFLGGSVFAFAAMLASFLTGITIGGGIAAKLSVNRKRAKLGFFYAQCATAGLALASWNGVEHLAGIINAMARSDTGATLPRTLWAILILLPPAVTIGMTFPFAIRIHARDERDAASSSAKVYACNTVGSVLGALLTGTYLLPATNYNLTLTAAIFASLAIAGTTLLFSDLDWRHVFAAIGVVVLLGSFYPSQPDELLRVSPFQTSVRDGVLEYVKTGRSATVTSFDDHGFYSFATNGLPEAGTRPKGSLVVWNSTPAWLGVLPSVYHPQTDSMLVVGFGSGLAAASAPRAVSSIDVFELEEGIIEANRRVGSARMIDPLADPRIHVIMNDGRSGLALTDKRYDAIVSQPSHPWTAGASHLYTKEFAELVHDHLTEDGVFVQWMDSGFLDSEILRSMGATLLDVFPCVYLFQTNESSLLFYASMRPWQIKPGVPALDNRNDQQQLARIGIQCDDDPLCWMSVDDAGMKRMCSDAEVTTDNNNLLALRMILTSHDDQIRKSVRELIHAHDPMCRLPTNDSPYANVDRAYVAHRRYLMNRRENAAAIIKSLERPEDRLLAEARIAIQKSEFQKAQQKLEKLFELDPTNHHAWFESFMLSKIDPSMGKSEYRGGQYRKRFSSKHKSVFDGIEALEKRDFNNMSEIDSRLAEIESSDPAYVAATVIRIDWRLRDENTATRRQRGIECLRLIDEVNPHTSASKLAIYRLNAAVLAGRPNIALTTAQLIASAIGGIGKANGDDAFISESPESLKRYLRHCLTVIEPLQRDPRVEKVRFYGVRYFINETLAKLEGES